MAPDILGFLRKAVSVLAPKLPLILFVFSIAAASSIYGYFVSASHIFPFRQIKFAIAAFRSLDTSLMIDTDSDGIVSLSHVLLRDMVAKRFTALAPQQPSENLVMAVWPKEFRDVCPGGKCLAVEISRDGKIVRTVPYRPEEFDKPRLADPPYEISATVEDTPRIPVGLQQLPGGDIVMTFDMRNGYPFGGGVARIRPDGTFVWFRSDYTHHWPVIVGPDEILLTATAIRDGTVKIPMSERSNVDLDCPTRYYADIVRIVDFNGKTREEFSALDMLIHSPARAVLEGIADTCDPLHLNYAMLVGPELAAHLSGVSPRDFLLSFNQLSALAIVGRDSHKLLHFYRGPFVHQHAVTPEHGSKVLVFDNMGSDGRDGPSRLLEYDLATGASRTVLPAGSIAANTYSEVHGTIALSSDKQRVLTCFSMAGICYEVRLSDGKPLMKFDNLGDARKADMLGPDRARYAARYFVNGLYYAQ